MSPAWVRRRAQYRRAFLTREVLLRPAGADRTTLPAGASAVLLLRYRVNSTWLVAGGALTGILLSRFS